MSWIDHCKIAFLTEAKARHYKRKRKRVDIIINKMSVESGIRSNLLAKWWVEDKYKIEIPICRKCNNKTVELHDGNPRTKKSKHYGLCITCRHKNMVRRTDKNKQED